MTSAAGSSSPSASTRPVTTPCGHDRGQPDAAAGRAAAGTPGRRISLAGLLDGVDVRSPSRTIRTTWRERPRGSGTTYVVAPLLERRCQGRVTSAGSGRRRDDAQRHGAQASRRRGDLGVAAGSRKTAPGPRSATSSSGLLSAQVRRLRQPQPMQPSSLSRSRSSRSICASIRGRQPRLSRAQSALVGVRPSGSVASASAISSRVSPTRWAERMNATRRSVARGSGAGCRWCARTRSARASS